MALTLKKKKPIAKPEKSSKEDRSSFRIDYPQTKRPTLIHKIGSYPLLDLSEGGFSFEIDPEHTFLEQEKASFEIRLLSGQSVSVRGRVVRVKGQKISVMCLEPIEYRLVMEEERTLLKLGLLREG